MAGGGWIDDASGVGGEDHAKHGPLALGALDLDTAPVFFADAFGDGEAQSGAFDALGSVE